ncbi:toll/interleukin-1 receptor domain-containing protein [Emcibacter sp. SYSU 3D8]|uniref:toll/interleukin-1 receptor domain-containing protein n=1 Tax=Emcibacter sp. SYSU 3D8 TaxID=3133969 RepID=UPI0031FE44AC
MPKIMMNGKTVRAGNIEKDLMRAVAANVVQQLRDRFSAIRHPETGEFARVIVQGDSIEDMSVRIEGSPELIEFVRDRFSPEEAEMVTLISDARAPHAKVFLSYASEDRELAKRIAEELQANGIEIWWAEWELGAGDSIRRKIDAGLGGCTHFIVLLSPTSITRPWVNEEIDAGFVRKVQAKSRFIPLRHGLAVDALPPLMSGMLAPEVDALGSNLQQLINDILGVSRKPPLGKALIEATPVGTGYSSAANKVAELFVRESRHGQFGDPQVRVDDIVERTGLTEDDVADALHELRHFFNISHRRVLPKEGLYSEFDRHWQPWDPADDALKLAADMLNDLEFPSTPKAIAERYGWSARRLNPAMAHLRERDAASLRDAMGPGPFITIRIDRSDSTRRFVKSRS